jgi:uncharacterized membrane protein YheB (UPF0754 family)
VKIFLLFAVPPLAGALVGFVTNVIAVRMLFRPLREIRVFGIRLPFTPGILPRQRHKLAEGIGAMAERELLVPEMLRRRFGEPRFQEKLLAAVSAFTGEILAAPAGEILQNQENFITGKIRARAESRYHAASASLVRFLRRDDIQVANQSLCRIAQRRRRY